MSVTAATVVHFDPHGVLDTSTSSEVVVVGPITLSPETDEGGTPARFVVLTTMWNVDSNRNWYVAAYHVHEADADIDYENEESQRRLCADENPEEYSDMHIGVALIKL